MSLHSRAIFSCDCRYDASEAAPLVITVSTNIFVVGGLGVPSLSAVPCIFDSRSETLNSIRLVLLTLLVASYRSGRLRQTGQIGSMFAPARLGTFLYYRISRKSLLKRAPPNHLFTAVMHLGPSWGLRRFNNN